MMSGIGVRPVAHSSCHYSQRSNYKGGDFPSLPMVVPGTKTALLVLSPPSNGEKFESVLFSVQIPPSTFLLIRALIMYSEINLAYIIPTK